MNKDHDHGAWMQLGRMKHCLVLLAATSVHSVLEALVLGIEVRLIVFAALLIANLCRMIHTLCGSFLHPLPGTKV